MESDISSDEIVSRVDDDRVPTERLVDHADAVASRARWLATGDNGGGSSDASILAPVGQLHDAGKAVPAFQRYIRTGNAPGQRKYTYHARLGAFALAYVLDERGVADREVLAGWAAVLRHHGTLPDLAGATIETIRSELDGDNNAWVSQQIAAIDDSERSRAVFDGLLDRASDGTVGWSDFREAMNDGAVYDVLLRSLGVRTGGRPRTSHADRATIPDGTYDRTIRLWSALTFADKTVASSVGRDHLVPEPLDLAPLDTHVDGKLSETDVDDDRIRAAASGAVDPTNEASLNALREASRRRVRRTAPDLLEHDIGLLTLPTGLGKTFSGITGAFELRDEIRRARGLDAPPLVVYALPYTSIIEQTREIFETDVFDADPTGRTFTTHHSLTETVTYTDNERASGGDPDGDDEEARAKLLGESWRSGVVLTTFVQLIESLAGPSNAAGLKLPALHDAVVVLDEPQAVPKPWWEAVRRLSRTLVDGFDARIVSMTATQPTLFTEGEFDTLSLLSSGEAGDEFKRRAYESVSRVRYRLDDSIETLTESDSGRAVSHAAAADRLIETALSADRTEEASVLSVCSTVASSRTLTEQVTERAALFGCHSEHIGTAYQTVLNDIESVDDSGSESVTPHPDPECLANETLRELGFTETSDGSWDRIADSDTSLLVGTFNARYRPLDRRVLIRVAEELSTIGVPFVFVSTQAIEAGVDISFTHAFRDVAPLDSVVQTAGRCNRSFEWGVEGGTVTVWCLDSPDEEDSTLPAQYIYPESGHLATIARILLDTDAETDGEEIPATTIELEAVEEYFQFVEERGFIDEDLESWIDRCDAEQLGRESLLGDDYETVDVLVSATEADDRRLERLREGFDTFEGLGYERLSQLDWMRVSVSVREIEELSMHARVDGSSRQSSDINVFCHPVDHGNGSYKLDGGGFVVTEGSVVNRFT